MNGRLELVFPPFAIRRQVACELETSKWFHAKIPDYAQGICDGCPVVGKCLDWAIEHNEEDGVWGGMTPAERKAEAERRNGRAAA